VDCLAATAFRVAVVVSDLAVRVRPAAWVVLAAMRLLVVLPALLNGLELYLVMVLKRLATCFVYYFASPCPYFDSGTPES
jgi:hypothetical protein